ncbi:hypothetical protein KUV22_07850 [Microbulbifer agarilyticus]|uniref:OmpW/AlkL family protein n=1 Tax=Microbulbifer agarilyticus TaxID=260552 RepID=UPI001C962021|nr:OmpW family outer membrane protein [Microbulbifer agarilyticus]MBY6190332.1 hypothetical protein [Microbulbifer agarilyticus]
MKRLRLTACLAILFPIFATAQIPVSDVDLTRFYLRIGASSVHPDDSHTSLKYYLFQDWELYRTSWETDDDTTWNISGVWRPLPYLGVELMHVGDSGHPLSLGNFRARPGRDNIHFGRFSLSSTNLFVNWYMTDLDCLGQPYLGIGVNYSDYHDDHLYPEFQNYLINSGMATGPGHFGVGHSWGVTAQLGVDWRLGWGKMRSWLINAAVIYVDSSVDAEVTFPTTLGYERLYSDFNTDPWTFNLGVTYEF